MSVGGGGREEDNVRAVTSVGGALQSTKINHIFHGLNLAIESYVSFVSFRINR
jgi:hypothetical protein